MGLRTTKLAAQGAELLPGHWQRRLDALAVDTEAAVAAADPARLGALFAEAAAWPHRQRSYQAAKWLAEAVLATPQRCAPTVWMVLYAVAADAMLTRLEDDPREPALLNYAGVFLYELAEAKAAETLFRAVVRIEPQNELARRNLKAAKRRRKGTTRGAPEGPLGADVRALAARATKVAGSVRPAVGLTLSLCMIVKDEEELLPGCLAAARDAVDEIVVVDTGSSDRTVEIAESFGAKVVHFPWNGSFADARNVSIEHATGDWLMYLDADEHLVAGAAEEIRALLGKTWREAFHLVEINYTGGDDSGEAVSHLAMRIWRNRPEYRFEGRIHEQKTRHMPNYLPERFETTTVRMLHYGYLKGRVLDRAKSERNIALLEAELQEQGMTPFAAFNLGTEWGMVGDVARSREYFESAWELLKKTSSWHQQGFAPMLVERLAGIRRDDGDLDACRAAVAEGLAVYPDHTDLVFKLGVCAFDEGNYDEAERQARRCLELGDAPARYSGTVGSGTYLALALLAQVAGAQGRLDEAETHYARALADHPNFVAVALPLAQLMLRRGATPEEVAERIPDRPSALLLAATACYEVGHAATAIEWFGRVLEKQPSNGAALVGIVEALLGERRFDEAVEWARRRTPETQVASKLAVSELFVHGARGDLESFAATLADADLAESDQLLLEAWRQELAGEVSEVTVPGEALAAAATMLEALLKVEEFPAFETLHRVYRRLDVPQATRSELLAAIYFRRGYLDSAAEEWMTSLQAEPAVGALLGLAHIAVAKGFDEDAVVFCEEALALEPEHDQAASLRQAVLARVAA